MASTLKKILVSTDLSDGSDEALSQAIELGKQTGAFLEIVYVRELGSGEFPFGPLYSEDASGVIAYTDLELARRRDRVTSAGLQCHYRCLDGIAAKEIVRRAEETNADLVSGLPARCWGAWPNGVVQHAACPVLTVPVSRKAA